MERMSHGAAAAAAAPPQQSPWHSPVPYLFGGLAAMIALIAFSLLILACSYWKLSGYLESGGGDGDGDGDGGAGVDTGCGDAVKGAYEERILVIMAGEEKPTFLATPASSRVSSLDSEKRRKLEEEGEGINDRVELGNGETLESFDQVH